MTKSYETAIDSLTSQGKFYINLGLERISSVLNLLGNVQNNLKVIHVAGTNGKGSVCSMLHSVLIQKYKVGLYTSPHIFDYTERIQINGTQISKVDFARLMDKVLSIADSNAIHLSEFEILTTMAFIYFAEQKVDFVVLETGLGGRLDATNVIQAPLCSIITHLDLDHTERLGDSIEKITLEKAGIIKQNCPVIVSASNSGLAYIEAIAKMKKSKLYIVEDINVSQELSLKGAYQKENAALVLKVLEVINKGISEPEISAGLKSTKHICRFQYIKDENLIIDGAHNPNGTAVLRKSLEEYFPNQSYRFIFGCLSNKDYFNMTKNLFKKEDEVYFYRFSNPNSATIEDIKSVCDFKIKPFSEFKKDSKQLTVVCGSFYMIKELLTIMGIKIN